MKTVVVGTDFSLSSLNASRYAALLASKLNSKLTIFNLFEAPIIHSNMGIFGISYTSLKKLSQNKSIKLANTLQKEFPKLKIDFLITGGSFEETLENFTSRHLVEAVVMGLKTKDKISKFIYGSHGVNIAGRINSPVIIVPESYKIHKINRVLLAIDNSEKINKSTLLGFERIVRQLKSVVKPIYIRTEDELFVPQQKSFILNGKEVKINVASAKDIQEGIRIYSKANNIQLISIISKSHSAIYNLFAESNTKKIAFQTKVPVMSIHE